MKKLLTIIVALFTAVSSFGQTKADIFKGDVPLTFLGLDFTQAKFVGSAAQWQDAGEVTNAAMRDKYIPIWNSMFSAENEKKNFKIAEATNRMDVSYATDVTDKVNKAMTNKDFFTNSESEINDLSDQQIAGMVKKYNFGGNTGLGLVFIVQEMKKGAEKGDPSFAIVWVTFVDMKTKSVLMTKRVQAKAGGFGFKNFWAGAWKSVIKEIKANKG